MVSYIIKKIELAEKLTPGVGIKEPIVENTDVLVSYRIFEQVNFHTLRFKGFLTYLYGEPNDEGFYHRKFYDFDYPNLGFELDCLYEISKVPDDFGKRFNEYLKDDYKRFILFSKDGTFHCISKGIEI